MMNLTNNNNLTAAYAITTFITDNNYVNTVRTAMSVPAIEDKKRYIFDQIKRCTRILEEIDDNVEYRKIVINGDPIEITEENTPYIIEILRRMNVHVEDICHGNGQFGFVWHDKIGVDHEVYFK